MITIRPATPDDFVHVAVNMRADERAQWSAFRAKPYNAMECAADMASHGLASWALLDGDGLAFYVGGLSNQRPGVFTTWAAGTPEGWNKHWRGITRESRRLLDDALANGAHRIEIVSLASRPEAGDWYSRGLGMKAEGTLHRYAGDGQDAIMYAKTTEKTR